MNTNTNTVAAQQPQPRFTKGQEVVWVEQKFACGVSYGSPGAPGVVVGVARAKVDAPDHGIKAGQVYYKIDWKNPAASPYIPDWNMHLQPRVDARILEAKRLVETYNNTSTREPASKSMRFLASPFAVDGPNGIRKNLGKGLVLRKVKDVDSGEGYAIGEYAITTVG